MPSVSTIALPFWAYLIGAVAFASIHDGNFAVILVLTFTVVSGLVRRGGKGQRSLSEQQAKPPRKDRGSSTPSLNAG